jgi:hypothetical protein
MTIDERLQFLLQSTESLHASCQELHAAVQKQAELVAAHERNWERTRTIIRAALRAGLEDENGEAGPQ